MFRICVGFVDDVLHLLLPTAPYPLLDIYVFNDNWNVLIKTERNKYKQYGYFINLRQLMYF